MLAARLRSKGHTVLESVEPGGTPIGQQIRRVLLDAKNQELCPTAELLLMFACRAQNVDQWILPALARGEIVVSDRFTDSTLAYQGAGRGLGAELVYEVDRIACRGLVPDLTLIVDIDTETGLARAHSRNRRTEDVETRIDQHEVSFHRKVREAYHQLAADDPKRIRLIDGGRPEEEVARDVWEAVRGLI
jgi:dTMP kinase